MATSLIPRVAILKPEARVAEEISLLFARHEYSLRKVTSIDEILELEADEQAEFDIIVVPLQLSDGSSGITACLRIRSEASIATRPVLGLAFGKEKTVLQAFYEVGADVIFIPPFDSDLIYLQITALARQRRGFAETLRNQKERTGLSHSIVSAFNSVREGLLMFDGNFELTFSNSSAQLLLGLSAPAVQEEVLEIERFFRRYISEHEKVTVPEAGSFTQFESPIPRIGGQSFGGVFRISTLFAGDHVKMGSSVALTDLSELAQLSNTLLQAQRTRSLCLLAAGCSLHFLETTGTAGSGIVVSPMMRLEEYLEGTGRDCSLNAMLTTLLEFLDLVISPNVSLKVQVKQELKLAVRPADFFQLLGQMILHAVEFSGQSGETVISVSENIPGEGVTVLVTGKSRKVTPFLPNDNLARMIQGNLGTHGQSEGTGGKLSSGLTAAQEIADKYRTAIEVQTEESALLRIRVRLPASYK